MINFKKVVVLIIGIISIVTNAHALLKDDVHNAALSEGTPEEIMKKVVKLPLEEAVVCLTKISDGVFYRLHTRQENDGLVTDEGEKEVFKDFFVGTQDKTPGDVKDERYVIQSGGRLKSFQVSITRIDPTHLCFSRMPLVTAANTNITDEARQSIITASTNARGRSGAENASSADGSDNGSA